MKNISNYANLLFEHEIYLELQKLLSEISRKNNTDCVILDFENQIGNNIAVIRSISNTMVSIFIMSENQISYECQNKKENFYILIHKNIPVAKLEIDDGGNLMKLFDVYNADHLPYSSPKESLNKIKAYLQDWMKNRSIPDLRPQLNIGYVLVIIK